MTAMRTAQGERRPWRGTWRRAARSSGGKQFEGGRGRRPLPGDERIIPVWFYRGIRKGIYLRLEELWVVWWPFRLGSLAEDFYFENLPTR